MGEPWKYQSNWYTEKLFTTTDVDNILGAVAIVSDKDPDPADPETAWILRTDTGSAVPDGTATGLLLALTYSDYNSVPLAYQFSYKSEDDVIHRLPIA